MVKIKKGLSDADMLKGFNENLTFENGMYAEEKVKPSKIKGAKAPAKKELLLPPEAQERLNRFLLLAAVGSVTPLFMMTMVLTIGLSNGCTVVTGQRYGAGDMEGMRRSIGTCTVLSVLFTLFIMGVFHLIIDPALVLMNIPAELLADAKAYVMIIVDGLFAMMGYNLLSGIMRSLGDSKTPLYFLIVSSMVNIALALFFILVLSWGVPGSAVALVIAQAISAILCLAYIYKRFPQLHISRRDFRLDGPEVWEHLRMGLPMAVQFSVLGLGIIILDRKSVV